MWVRRVSIMIGMNVGLLRAAPIGHWRSSVSTIVARGKAGRSAFGTIRKAWDEAACCMLPRQRASGLVWFPAAMTMLKGRSPVGKFRRG